MQRLLSGASKRAIDLVGRYGGEEFVLLLPATNETQARQIAERCFSAVKQQNVPHELSTISDAVTFSAGVSTIIPTGETHSSKLIEAADKFLYQAKQNGRNRFEYRQE